MDLKDLVCADYASASRRRVLAAGAAGLLPWLVPGSALAQVRTNKAGDGRALVVVFLRGGADGLNILVPHGDDGYYRARPTLGIPKSKLVATGERFGLHPALRPLERLWNDGRIAAVPACGSGDSSRSHFEAMATMESGAHGTGGNGLGWLARYVAATPEREGALRALALGDTLPASLRGAVGATAVGTISDLRLPEDPAFAAGLARAYAKAPRITGESGRRSLQLLDKLRGLASDPKRGNYPDSKLGKGLREVATLLRADVGLEIAALDSDLWDTHVAQGADTGWQAKLLDDLGTSLAAFAADLGPELDRTTILVMTEFGRRVAENDGLGTDHGLASVMFAIGGRARGGVHGAWPGLDAGALDEVGDLPPSNDYRAVLAGALSSGLGFEGSIFAGLPPMRGVFDG